MAVKSTSTPRLLVCLLVLAILNSWSPLLAGAAGSAPGAFDIGTPTLTELWVSVNGNDSNSGLANDAPLKTLTAAFAKIPATLTTTGYRINLLAGTYPCEPAETDNCQNNFGNRQGTFEHPIIVRASSPGTVTLRGGLDLWNLSYLYLIDLKLAGGTPLPTNASGNNLLHLANVDHILLRGLTLAGPECPADSCNNLQEDLKVNQAQYLYVEGCDISGAWHSVVDYFAVQYGHFINNNVHTAGQWAMYVKGGTSYLRIEGNEFHDCQLGFSAGQSANFPMMRPPWLHYEAYAIKFVNNILHDLQGVGLNAGGGYNVLFAHNTLYRVGVSTDSGYPLFSLVRGERGCNPTDELPNPLPTCLAYIDQGGWGPSQLTDNLEAIPNANIYVYNNIFYNPAPAQTMYTHLSILDPMALPAGFQNLPATITTDQNLSIRGNLIWNGDALMPLGIEETQACQATNAACNEEQIKAQNTINSVEPTLTNPMLGNYQPTGTWTATTYLIPDFIWDIAGVPAGDTGNAVATDFQGVSRAAIDPPGAYHNTALLPLVLSSVRTNPNPTTADSVEFTVTFSTPVSGVDASDFTLTAIGITGATVSAVSGSGNTYTVTVTSGTGSGTLRLNVVDNDTIVASGSNPLGGNGPGNGDFLQGQHYAVRPFTQAIKASWNLLSWPVTPTDPEVDTLLAPIKEHLTSAWKWQNNAWAVYLPAMSPTAFTDYINEKGFAALATIHGGEGFWLNSTMGQSLEVTGNPPADLSLALLQGWNLVGLKTANAQTVVELISGHETQITSLWKWENDAWSVNLPAEEDSGQGYAASKAFALLTTINPGEGLWVNATTDLTLP